MKIVATSDLHGNLPAIPSCDLLIIAGDICPLRSHDDTFQRRWLNSDFKRWLCSVPAKHIVGVAGNHDLIFEQRPDDVPALPWHYLQDSEVSIEGLRIYGMPWQRRFFDWAFNLDEPELSAKYAAIPAGVDIVVSHGPAYGLGDRAPRQNAAGFEHTGSKAFLERVREIAPWLVVTGHIHCDPGVWFRGKTIFVNASLLDNAYRVKHKPYELYVDASPACLQWHIQL